MTTLALWRWPETQGEPVCPRCQHGDIWRMNPRHGMCFRCAGCGYNFAELTGTLFHAGKLGPDQYLRIIEFFDLPLEKRPSMSQFSKTLGVHNNSLWEMDKNIIEARIQMACLYTRDVLEAKRYPRIRPESERDVESTIWDGIIEGKFLYLGNGMVKLSTAATAIFHMVPNNLLVRPTIRQRRSKNIA